MSQRPIYIISYTSPLFPAHWSLWIPSPSPPFHTGKIIHVEGDSLNGFTLQFKRNYNVEEDECAKTIHLIGVVEGKYVVDSEEGIGFRVDVEARDKLEECAVKVEVPGGSLRGVVEGEVEGKRTRVEIRNCQTWLRDFVVRLVEEGILGEDAIAKVDAVPKN